MLGRIRLAQRLDAITHGHTGANPDDGLDVCLYELRHDGFVIWLVAVGLDDDCRFPVGLFESLHRSRKTVFTKAVVHMHHGNAQVAHRMECLYRLFCLSLVTGPYIEYQRIHWLMKHHCPRGWGHQGNTVLCQVGQDGLRVGRGTAHE
ncbi:hypothetical protein D3C72_1162520 [compost metagenome]